MQDDDDIPFDVPFHWRVFSFSPPNELAKEPGSRLGFYRIQRRDGSEVLPAPIMVDVEKDGHAQLKILYGESVIYYNEQVTEATRLLALELMKHVAETLNDEEHDGGLYEMEQAHTRAGIIIMERVKDDY